MRTLGPVSGLFVGALLGATLAMLLGPTSPTIGRDRLRALADRPLENGH
ncbi:MAG: hypothetical protein ACREM2_05300 [Vulcanimicrobiaceae bacterium]